MVDVLNGKKRTCFIEYCYRERKPHERCANELDETPTLVLLLFHGSISTVCSSYRFSLITGIHSSESGPYD